jgi:hypothetical protein
MWTKDWRIWLLGILLIPCWVIAWKYDIDLVNLHVAAQFSNSDLSRVYAQNGNYGRWFYPPFSVALIKPLGLFSYSAVKWFWIPLQTFAYFVFWTFLYRIYPGLPKMTLGWILVWIVSINPIHNNYQSNNIQLMLAAMLVVAEYWSYSKDSKKLLWSGALVAFAASIKMFPLFLVPLYLILKPWKVRVGVVAGLAFAQLLPFVVFGPQGGMDLYHYFLQNLGTYEQDNSLTKIPDILCLPSLSARFFTGMGLGDHVKWINKLLVLGISGVFFLWVIFRKNLTEKNQRFSVHVWALAMALMALLNPSTRPHYFIFYVPAFASLVELIKDNPGRRWLTFSTGVSCLLIAFTAEGVVGKSWNESLESASIPTWGMIILCVALALGLKRAWTSGDGGSYDGRDAFSHA